MNNQIKWEDITIGMGICSTQCPAGTPADLKVIDIDRDRVTLQNIWGIFPVQALPSTFSMDRQSWLSCFYRIAKIEDPYEKIRTKNTEEKESRP